MKRKLLSILLIGVMVIGLTGCGKSNIDSSDVKENKKETTTNQKEENTENKKISNETIENVAKNYYTNLYKSNSEKAYKYVDFIGVIAWIKKDSAKPIDAASVFIKKYNEISNDTEFKNKIVSHFSDKRIYERIDSEIKAREVTVEVSDINDLGENLYSARIKVLYDLNGTNTGIDKTLHFIKSSDGFYIVDDSALWSKTDVTDLIGTY